MLYIAWGISVIVAFALGYYIRKVTDRIESLEAQLKQKVDKPEKEAPSQLVDPYDEVQTAIYERDKLMKKLNP